MTHRWCESPFSYARRATREVRVGQVGVGGDNPIRVQSMTTPATTDTEATVSQITRLVEAGCEIVRVTVPTSADAKNLPEIRRALAARKIVVPLVADIHFSPGAALKAVEHVEKIRVNPGNYADRKQFAVREYTDAEYESELERLAETFRPLVARAKQLGVAMRIGTNHGSLSDRILNRYGDSPLGMVESALEFVRICESEGYRELILSMKSSNPVVTIEAYRLLAARMHDEGMNYPFHLGVTEAGDGADGRIKSAIGIGSLLDDGIGDTVRVSLTEDPVAEIPVAMSLVEPYNRKLAAGLANSTRGAGPVDGDAPLSFDPFSYSRRRARIVRFGPCAAGGEETARVEVRLRSGASQATSIRAEIDAQAGPRVPAETRADLVEAAAESGEDLRSLGALRQTMRLVAPNVALSARPAGPLLAQMLDAIGRMAGDPAGRDELSQARSNPSDSYKAAEAPDNWFPLQLDRVVLPAAGALPFLRSGRLSAADLPPLIGCPVLLIGSADELLAAAAAGSGADSSAQDPTGLRGAVAVSIPVPSSAQGPAPSGGGSSDRGAAHGHFGTSSGANPSGSAIHQYRRLAGGLDSLGSDLPIVLSYGGWDGVEGGPGGDDELLAPSLVLGSLLCDGIGDAISVHASDAAASRALGFNILQAARVRISKTEFISCPSCGRTLFDLEETTRRIKDRTAHLKGLKIAIMGCVVNGPGEMADADFGYVGWGTDKIALFVGKEMVARDIPVAEADDRLVALIKEHGKWHEPALSPEPAG